MDIDDATLSLLRDIIKAKLPWIPLALAYPPFRSADLLAHMEEQGLVTIWRRPDGPVVCLTPLAAEVMRVEIEETSDPEMDEEYQRWTNNPEINHDRESWITRPIPALPKPVICKTIPGQVRLGHPERLVDRRPEEWEPTTNAEGKIISDSHGQPVWHRILSMRSAKGKTPSKKAGRKKSRKVRKAG